MAGMVTEEEHNDMPNYAHICAVSNYIRLVHRLAPELDLQPLFAKLLGSMANNPPPYLALPLSNLAKLGCPFPLGTELMEPPQAVPEDTSRAAENVPE